jgi:hypothetical protein
MDRLQRKSNHGIERRGLAAADAATREKEPGCSICLRRIGVFIMALLCAALATSCGNRLAKRAAEAWMTTYRISLTTDDEPWKMFEGIYAFGSNYIIADSITQKRTQVVSYIGSGAIEWLIKEDADGPYFAAGKGDVPGELHRNQFLADLISAKVDPLAAFATESGETDQISDFTFRAMRRIDPDELTASNDLKTGPDGNELGWTLIAFSQAKLSLSSWKNQNGKQVGFTDLLEIALNRPVNWGSYEGTIEQLGIAVALNEYKKDRLAEAFYEYDVAVKKNPKTAGLPPTMDSIALTGIWAKAQKHVDGVVAILKKNQNPDGTFSRYWFEKKQKSADFEEVLLYTGQALDFLAVALNDNQLKDEWVVKIVNSLSRIIARNRYQLQDKIWASTHAGHALFHYRDRLLNVGHPIKTYQGKDPDSCCGNKQ